MIKIKATDEQILQMAANASAPAGIGIFHFDGSKKFYPADFQIERGSNPGLWLDYVQGRMVKFSAWRKGDNHWEVHGEPRSDYQSWSGEYPTWESLALSAGAECVPAESSSTPIKAD